MKPAETLLIYLKKSVFSFGASVLFLICISYAVGDEAKEISPMFAFGHEGLPLPVLAEFFGLSVLFALERFLFFTDCIIKKMGLVLRTACTAICAIATAVAGILVFRWFPTNNALAWVSFAISFLVCLVGSLLITYTKEKRENRKMADALEKMKKSTK